MIRLWDNYLDDAFCVLLWEKESYDMNYSDEN